MKVTAYLSCMTLLGSFLVAGHPPTGTETAASEQSRGATPSKPSTAPDAPKKNEKSSRTRARDKQARALEEQLQRGDLDQAIAQGQVSDHLERLHKGPAEQQNR
jgi:hypothetical protein